MLQDKTIDIAFLGLGRVYKHYKKILKDFNISGFKVVSVCDINKKKADEESQFWSCYSFCSLEEMLKKTKPNLIIILTPSGVHYENAKFALENNLNVLVEKPATMTPAKSLELYELSKQKGKMLGVAFQNRFNPSINFLKKIVDNGDLGEIITTAIRLRWCRFQAYYEDDWHGKWDMDGGVINQQAIHHLDALSWIFGPIDSVSAISENRLNTLEAEDTLVAALKFNNGSLGTIEATTAARDKDFEASLEVVSENGIVQIGGIALNQIKFLKLNTISEDEKFNIIKNYSRDVSSGYGTSHSHILQKTFNNLLEGKTDSPVPISTTLPTTYLVHALYKSVESMSWVKIKSLPESKNLGRNN